MSTVKRDNSKIIAVIVSCVLLVAILISVVIVLITSNKKLNKSIYNIKYAEFVYKYSDENNIDPNLVFAIIQTESHFDADAESQVGALGLMQLMPATFEWLQTYKYGEVTLETESLLDPETNIKYGCIFLKFLTERYSVEDTAIAAYNAGFGAVDGWLENSDYSSDGINLDYIPYPETDDYVKKVKSAKNYYESNCNDSSNITEELTTATYGLIDDREKVANDVKENAQDTNGE